MENTTLTEYQKLRLSVMCQIRLSEEYYQNAAKSKDIEDVEDFSYGEKIVLKSFALAMEADIIIHAAAICPITNVEEIEATLSDKIGDLD